MTKRKPRHYVVKAEDTIVTERDEQCPSCFGTGATDFDRIMGRVCRYCGGTGQLHIIETQFKHDINMLSGDTLTVERIETIS